MLEMSYSDSNSSSDDEVTLKRKITKRSVNWAPENKMASDSETDSDTSDGDVDALDTTIMPAKSSTCSRESSVLVQSSNFKVFKAKLYRMVEEHKDCLKRLPQKERADNKEFFALVSYNQTGELPSADNTTHYPPVIHNGINLMQIHAGASAAKFGRHLGGIMHGKDEDCKLQKFIIGAQRLRKDTRTPVPGTERESFELVVRRKYPKFQETAYNEARHGANQMGLDIKYRKEKQSVSTE